MQVSLIQKVAKSIGIPLECSIDGGKSWLPEVSIISSSDTQYRISPCAKHMEAVLENVMEQLTEVIKEGDYFFRIPKGTMLKGNYFLFLSKFMYYDGNKLHKYDYENKAFDIDGTLMKVDLTEIPVILSYVIMDKK